MTMNFALSFVFILSCLYAVAITAWKPGYQFAQRLDWLAFSLGELMVIGAVQVMGTVTANDLFLLNAVGALPMVLRWAYLDLTADNRRTLRTLYGTTQGLDRRERIDTD